MTSSALSSATFCKVPAPHRRTPALACRAPRVAARAEGGGGGGPLDNPLFNDSFKSVLQQSLQRQGPDALLANSRPEEPRVSATEEVLQAALQQSRQTLLQLQAWQAQVERQVEAQEKQVDRIQFALTKSRNDAAYMNVLKDMLHNS